MSLQAHAETFRAQNPPTRTISQAAERYLEQYGDPLVMNTYLKVTILVLALVCLMLGLLVFRSQKALANIHPLVLRIDDVGHAEALDFHDFAYRPKEVENKYYLSRWTELYFGRNRYTIQRDFTNSLYFMNADVQRAVVEDYRKNKTIDAFVRDSTHSLCRYRSEERHSGRPPAVPVFGPRRVSEDLHESL